MRDSNKIVLGLLIPLFSSNAWAETSGELFGVPYYDCERIVSGHVPCAERSEVKIETGTYDFPSADFSWRCNEVFNYLYIDFLNSSPFQIQSLIIEGVDTGERFTEDLFGHVESRGSGSLMTAMDHPLCRNNENLVLSFEYQVHSGGVCIQRMSGDQLREIRAQCGKELAEQDEREAIYNNCVIAKSKDVDARVLPNVRSVCREISKNPSQLQRWRWGN